MEAGFTADSDQLAAETYSIAAPHDGESHLSISRECPDASPIPAAPLQLLQTSEEPPEESPEDGTPTLTTPTSAVAASAAFAGPAADNLAVANEASGATAVSSATLMEPSDTASNPTFLNAASPSTAQVSTATDGTVEGSDVLQQQAPLEVLDIPGSSAAVSAAEAMALQQPSLEAPDQSLPPTVSQTDAAPDLTPLSTAAEEAVVNQTAADDTSNDVASPEAAVSDLSAATSTGAVAREGSSQATQPSLKLWPLPLDTQLSEPSKLNSSGTGPNLDRAVSESALLSDLESQSLDTQGTTPKRRSLLSRLRPGKGSKGGSALGRTASNPTLLSRQSSADTEKLKSPTKRLSLSALLRRGSSGRADAAVVEPATVASGGDAEAATAAGASTDVVGTLGSPSAAAATAVLEASQSFSQPQAVANPRPLLTSAITSGPSSAQDQGLMPQSAPASPRGRPGTAPPQGDMAQPELALGRAVSDPSLLVRLPSGMYSVPTTPRRMSLLGRLSRGRRSNSIMPEPSPAPLPGQLQPVQEATLLEVPFAEQPFAEQPSAEQPRAEQPSAEQPLAKQPSAGQPLAEQPLAEQPFAEQPSAEQPFAKELLAEQPSALQPLAEQPCAEQPSDEQPSAETPYLKQPLVEQLPVEQPSAKQPLAEQPLAEQPLAEQPLDEQTLTEQPSAQQPLAAGPLPVPPICVHEGAHSAQQLHEEQDPADPAEHQGVGGKREPPPHYTRCCIISS